MGVFLGLLNYLLLTFILALKLKLRFQILVGYNFLKMKFQTPVIWRLMFIRLKEPTLALIMMPNLLYLSRYAYNNKIKRLYEIFLKFLRIFLIFEFNSKILFVSSDNILNLSLIVLIYF